MERFLLSNVKSEKCWMIEMEERLYYLRENTNNLVNHANDMYEDHLISSC